MSITEHFNEATLEKLKKVSQPFDAPDDIESSDVDYAINLAIKSGCGPKLKEMQTYLKNNNVFLDYHSCHKICKLESVGMVMKVRKDELGEFVTRLYFCPLFLEPTPDIWYYHFYELVFNDDKEDLAINSQFFTSNIEDITECKCMNILNFNESWKEMNSNPQFIQEFCNTLKNMNLLKMPAGSGTCAKYQEHKEVSEKGFAKFNYFGSKNDYYLVVCLSKKFMNMEF